MRRALAQVFLRLRSLFLRARVERDLDDELRYHLERDVEEQLASGLTEAEARASARRKLGPIAASMEECRDTWRVRFADERLKDIRFAWRQLIAHRGFAATAVLVFGLGVASAVSIFAFIDAALIRPLPYARPSQLVTAFAVAPARAQTVVRANVSYLDFLDWRMRIPAFASAASYDVRSGFTLTTATGPQRVSGLRVTSGFFGTLGVAMHLGRDFERSEEGPSAPPTVVLTYGVWQTRFGGRPDIIGQTVILEGEPHVVIGVLPQGFMFAMAPQVDFWATIRANQPCWSSRRCRSMEVVARLGDRATVASASTAFTSVIERLRTEYPDSHRQSEIGRLVPLSEVTLGDVRPMLLLLGCGAGLLLLIACVNIVSLLLARSNSRFREFALRRALGASTTRLVWQFTTEALVLATFSCGGGVVAAFWGMRLLSGLLSADMLSRMPYFRGIGMNGHVVAFAGALSAVAALVFAIAPMSRLSTTTTTDGLRDGSRWSAATTWRRFGMYLVVVELALAIVLLVNAGLLGKSFYRLLHVNTGFNMQHLVTVSVREPPGRPTPDTTKASGGVAQEVAERIAAVPSVQAVGYADLLPLGPGLAPSSTFWVPGRPEQQQFKEDWPVRHVSASYFRALQTSLLQGRFFADDDLAAARAVAILNETAVRRYFPGENPIGRSLSLGSATAPASEIVGVVADVKEGPPETPAFPTIYLPFNQTDFSLVIRTSEAEQAVVSSLVAAIHDAKPDLIVSGATTMTERLNQLPSTSLHRSSSALMGGFATVAFLLSVCGLYGVVAYSVGERRREIGVRMALGAGRGAIYRLVMVQVTGLVAIGSGVGLIGAVAIGMLVRGLLFDVQAWDPLTLTSAATVLVTAALLAGYVPARSAASVNPIEVLRTE